MDDESKTTPVEGDEAPVTEAAPEETGAPAGPPEGYVEEKRYQDAQAELNRQFALRDRARQGDRDAFNELLEGAYQLPDEEVPDQEDEEGAYGEAEVADPVARQWIEEQKAKENLALFNAHLDRLAGDPSALDDFDRQGLLQASIAGGFNEQATEKAFNDWKERNDAREKAQFEKWKKSKTGDRVSKVGTGANERPYRADMSLDERIAAAQEQARLTSEQ